MKFANVEKEKVGENAASIEGEVRVKNPVAVGDENPHGALEPDEVDFDSEEQ